MRTKDGRRRVRLHVVAARRSALRLVVTGPSPSCRRVGVLNVRLRRGGNDVLFGGRVRGKQLEPGIYTLTPRLARGASPTPVVVRVGPRGGVVALDRNPHSCAHVTGAAGTGTGTDIGFAAKPTSRTAAPAEPAGDAKLPAGHGTDSADLPRSTGGTLGASATHLGRRVADGFGDFGVVGDIVATALLALIVAVLGVSAVLVLRFFRGSWNP